MRKLYGYAAVMLAMTLLSAQALMAQEPGERMRRMHEQRAKNIEDLRLLKLLEVLDLDDEQRPQFISYFVSYRKDAREINDSMQSVVDSLADSLQSGQAPDKYVKSAVRRIESLRDARQENIRNFHINIEKILTAVQMGKVVVFEERFERELLETMGRYRMGHMTPPAP